MPPPPAPPRRGIPRAGQNPDPAYFGRRAQARAREEALQRVAQDLSARVISFQDVTVQLADQYRYRTDYARIVPHFDGDGYRVSAPEGMGGLHICVHFDSDDGIVTREELVDVIGERIKQHFASKKSCGLLGVNPGARKRKIVL